MTSRPDQAEPNQLRHDRLPVSPPPAPHADDAPSFGPRPSRSVDLPSLARRIGLPRCMIGVFLVGTLGQIVLLPILVGGGSLMLDLILGPVTGARGIAHARTISMFGVWGSLTAVLLGVGLPILPLALAFFRARRAVRAHGPYLCERCMYPLAEDHCPECGLTNASELTRAAWRRFSRLPLSDKPDAQPPAPPAQPPGITPRPDHSDNARGSSHHPGRA